MADWYGEDEEGCEGDAGRAEWTHGAAAEAVQGAEGSALTLALKGSHLSLWLAFGVFCLLTSCSSDSLYLTSEKYEGSCQTPASRADT